MKNKIFFLLLISSLVTYAKDIVIKGNFIGTLTFEKVVLKQYYYTIKNIQTAQINKNTFSFTLDDQTKPGVYRLFFGENTNSKFIDVIINGNDPLIEFNYDMNNNEFPLSFLQSDENIKYTQFLNYNNTFLAKFSVKLFFLQNYPDVNESVYQKVYDTYKKDIILYTKERDKFLQSNNKITDWAYNLVKSKPVYFPNEFKKDSKVNDYDKIQNYWNNIDTSNEKLLNSPVYFDLILDYFKFYLNSNPNLYQNEVENLLIENTDKVISKFSSNPNTQKFAIEYLQNGFKEIGAESLLKYIDLKYKNIILSFLNDENEKSNYLKRLDNYEKLKVGNLVPNIKWQSNPDINSISSLYDIKSEKLVLVFWSSECDHCAQIMPKIDEWANAHKSYTVLAIGIENNKELHLQELKKYKNILHYSDYNGWKSQCVLDYDIMATPTFYLLDQNKKVIKKAATFSEIESNIN